MIVLTLIPPMVLMVALIGVLVTCRRCADHSRRFRSLPIRRSAEGRHRLNATVLKGVLRTARRGLWQAGGGANTAFMCCNGVQAKVRGPRRLKGPR